MITSYDYLNIKIKPRQQRLKHALFIQDKGHSVWTKTPFDTQLSLGCQACKAGTWMCIFVGSKCNADCQYCPQGSREDKDQKAEDDRFTRYMPIIDAKSLIAKQAPVITGISYSGGEPLLYLSKIIDLASFVTSQYPHLYQWLYTNGILLNKEILKQLADLNIQELRIHLGATDFSASVLRNTELAVRYIQHVNIETPATHRARDQLIDNGLLRHLLNIGIKQVNLAELKVHNALTHKFIANAELYNYCEPGFMVTSPVYSREITYDIMEYAICNNFSIIINDCSNAAKAWQQYMSRKNNLQLFC